MRQIIIVMVALMPLSAQAASKGPTPDQMCELAGSWAGVVMRARQLGHPMSRQIEMMASAPGGSRAGVIAAYEIPRFSSPGMQEKAVQDFRNEIELDCYKRSK